MCQLDLLGGQSADCLPLLHAYLIRVLHSKLATLHLMNFSGILLLLLTCPVILMLVREHLGSVQQKEGSNPHRNMSFPRGALFLYHQSIFHVCPTASLLFPSCLSRGLSMQVNLSIRSLPSCITCMIYLLAKS